MEARLVTEINDFYSLQEDWERLETADPDVTYFSTFLFNKTWWEVYKDDTDKSLFIISVYDNKRVVGIAPFIIETHCRFFFKWRILKFLGKGDYLGLILDRECGKTLEVVKEIFRLIMMCRDKWDRIQLTQIKHDSYLAFYFFKSNEYNYYFTPMVECPQLFLSKYNNFDEYLRQYGIRNTIRHKKNLEKETGYVFKVINNKLDYDVYERISCVHIKEQKYLNEVKNMHARCSLFEDKKMSQFLKKLFFNNHNIITFFLEDRNGKLINYVTCYIYKNIIHCWNVAYNPEYKNYNSGRVLQFEILNHIFKTRIADVIDYGAGRYTWKFEWTRDYITIYQLDLWNDKSPKTRLFDRLCSIKNTVKGCIKRLRG